MIRPLNDNSEWDQTRKYLETPTRKFEEECINTLLGTFSSMQFIYMTLSVPYSTRWMILQSGIRPSSQWYQYQRGYLAEASPLPLFH
jgi:hypothetical protein